MHYSKQIANYMCNKMMYDVIQNGFWLDSFANIFSIVKTLKKLMLRTLKRGKNKKRRNDFTSMSTAH